MRQFIQTSAKTVATAFVQLEAKAGAVERLLAIAWSAIENSCRQILSLAFFFVSVHFLHPNDLGIFSMALAINSIPMIFIDEMVGESLIQKTETSLADWNTGFTINVLLAVGFLVLMLFLSAPLAHLLNAPSLRLAIPILSFASLAGALGAIQKAYLGRLLRFRLIAQSALIGQIVSGAVAVGLAVKGFGYWALIENVVGGAIVCSIVLWWYCPWKPHFHISLETIRTRRTYAAYVVIIRSIYLLRDQSPLIIAGLWFGLTEMGFFSLALRVARSLSMMFEDVTTRPLLAIVSREQHDMTQFGLHLIDALSFVATLALPSYFGLAVIGPQLLPVVFGHAWTPAGVYLPWVCIVLGSWLALHITAVCLRARLLGSFAVALTATLTLLDVGILTGLAPFGLQTAVFGWAMRNLLSLPIAVYMLHTRLGVSVISLLKRCASSLVATLCMVGIMLIFKTSGITGNPELIFIIAVAGLIYCLVTAVVNLTQRKTS